MKTVRKWIFTAIGSLILCSWILGGVNTMIKRTGQLPSPPQPNGYEQFLAVAREVKKPPGDLADLSYSQIQSLAATNKPALDRVRQSLTNECRVVFGVGKSASAQHDADLKKIKTLGIFFAIESKALILDGKTNEAVVNNLNTIHLGQEVSRGGDRVDVLNGLLLEVIGIASIQSQVENLDAPACKQIAGGLLKLEARRDSVDQIAKNDVIWTAHKYGLVGKLGDLLFHKTAKERRLETGKRWEDVSNRAKHLAIRLSSRAFRIEHGRPPTNILELVPAYLDAVPADTQTGAPMDWLPPAENPAKSVASKL